MGTVERLRALGAGGRASGAQVAMVARARGVSTRTIYSWLNDARLTKNKSEPHRKRYVPTQEHLAVLAHEQDRLAAHARLSESGQIACSYATFARALRERTDPALLAAALEGPQAIINKRGYLGIAAPHRNHTLHIDHVRLDVWVWPDHRARQPIRPWVTTGTDGATGFVQAVPWKEPAVNADMMAAALVDFATDRDYFGTVVGGIPEQIVLDNAKEHFAEPMRAGAERLGFLVSPTMPHSAWQNGKAERVNGMLNQRLARKLPGATKGGKKRDGSPRFSESVPEDISEDDVLAWGPFVTLLQACVDEINTRLPMRRLGGKTRLEAYQDDETERRPVGEDLLRASLMYTHKDTYRASKSGLWFDGEYYQGTGIEPGADYKVRFLPRRKDFIEVFTPRDRYVTRAYPHAALPPERRQAFLTARSQQEKYARQIESAAQRHRRHIADLGNSGLLTGDDGALLNAAGHPGTEPSKSRPLPRVPVTRWHRRRHFNRGDSRLERRYGTDLPTPKDNDQDL